MPKPPIILGISPGTRSMGIAIWKGNRLSEWQIKAFKGTWGETKLRDILYTIKELIEHFEVSLLTLKVPNTFHSSDALDRLYLELHRLARNLKVKVKHSSLSELKQICSDEPSFTKADLVRTIAEQN